MLIDEKLQARLLKETSDLNARKQQLEDKIRNLDVLTKIQVSILDLLTTRLEELAMEIGMRRSGAYLRKHFDAQLDQYEPSLKVAPYLFLFTTRN